MPCGRANQRILVGTSLLCVMVQVSLLTIMSILLMLWSTPAEPATLVWDANREPDLAGYRVYQCSQTPCRKKSSSATLLASLGKVTSFNIGDPVVIQFYMVTAYDSSNNESRGSNVVTYTPPGTPPMAPPPAPPNLRLTLDQ